jgi:phosphoglucosamine mutase
MTAEMALALGQAIAHVFRGKGVGRRRILIGKDTRLSGYMFEDAMASGIASMGADVIQVGPMPTPGLAFLTTDMRCDAGVMISASHNAYEDNGIKFFGDDGFKLADELEDTIEDLIESGKLAGCRAKAEGVGRAKRIEDATGRYVVALKNTFPMELSLDGLRVVLDCANGAAYKVGPTVLAELGAEVVTLGVSPNGRNINDKCGSLHPDNTAAKVRETRADLGIALDGDADRVVVVDEQGNVLDGDVLMGLFARELAGRGELKGGSVVATVMSNLGLEKFLERDGLSLIRTQVGDRYVVETMRGGGYNLGGEQSGHLIFLDHAKTGDGLMSGLQTLAIMARAGRPLSELTQGFERFPQITVNVRVAEKRPIDQLPALQKAIKEVEAELAGRGRVLIRYSGTEPKARIMVEGEDATRVETFARDLADELQRALAGVNGD